MKTFLTIGLISSLLNIPTYAHDLTVKVDNIESTKGFLYISLHNTDKTWMTSQQSVQAKKIPMEEKAMTVIFKDLPDGDYAALLFQDENENGYIDKNAFGIPTEPYGFSQNGGSFGPPSFKDASVNLKENSEITIYLQ